MDVMDRHGLLVTRFDWQVDDAEAEAAVLLLDGLKVRPDAWTPKTAYDRRALPISWARIARLGMDMKDVLLARQIAWDGRVYDSDGFTLKHAVMAGSRHRYVRLGHRTSTAAPCHGASTNS